MKQLSIKEKAKAYDEAIKRVEDIKTGKCETRFMFTEGLFEHIFPALKESEDERIMGNIIATIHLYYGEPLEDEAKEMIAWLEKQGEHAKFRDSIQVGDKVTRNQDGVLVNLSQLKRVAKPAVKIEPKFKIGDTVTVKPMSCHGKVFKGEPFKIVDIIEDNYVSNDGKTYSISLQDGWELVEQKPADYIERYNMSFEEAQEYISKRGFDIPWTDCDVFVDFRYVTQTVANILRWADDNPKQKPADTEKGAKGNEREIPNSAWTEEDDKLLTSIWRSTDLEYLETQGISKENAYKWIFSIKDRIRPKQEWSEEDELYIRELESLVKQVWATAEHKNDKDTIHKMSDLSFFLKTLKPQNHWKPSEGQLECLGYAIAKAEKDWSPLATNRIYLTLKALKEQLLELRGSKVWTAKKSTRKSST